MVFDTVEPGFSGQMEWNEVHVRLANLLRLPKAWGGRHSSPDCCRRLAYRTSLKLMHSYISLTYSNAPRHLVLFPCQLLLAIDPPCVSHPDPGAPTSAPLPSSPTPMIFDLSHDASLSHLLGSRESPIRIDPPSTVIEVDLDAVTIPHDASPSRLVSNNRRPPSTVIEVDLDKATTALASAAPHDTPGSAAHPSSNSDLHLISATFPQDPIPTSTWYFVGVGVRVRPFPS
ncbi:hypothetical protein BS47DRAFT_1402348 [Hydnum rufescens UP504]|uniref:Uncharacterized protein n=1 Tax=Hydnum rufescens UP504 TaxID=1448309 RepID=A0A9P6AD55_9AGAM|nr:hypothetical protein BS47DRAFT_1402348 [Hydnum rufescens UP504]